MLTALFSDTNLIKMPSFKIWPSHSHKSTSVVYFLQIFVISMKKYRNLKNAKQGEFLK